MFAGEPCEIYHIILESKSFLEKMTVVEHTIPFFLPIREAESDLLFSNAVVSFSNCFRYCTLMRFILIFDGFLPEIYRQRGRSSPGLCG